MQNNNKLKLKERLSIGESAEYLEVSIDTLRRWEKKNVLTALRSPGGHRYFLKKDLDKLFGQKYTRVTPLNTHEETKEKRVSEIQPNKVKVEDKKIIEDIIKTETSVDIKEESAKSQQVLTKEVFPTTVQIPQVKPQATSSVLTPPRVFSQQPVQNIPYSQPLQQQNPPKKEISWTTIIIIGMILFTVIDLVLLIVYLTSSQPLATPVP